MIGLGPDSALTYAPEWLQQRLQAQGYGYRVVNASVSGETTAGGLARLPHALAAHDPRIVVIELGANDGLRGLPLEATRSNLDAMISLAAEQPFYGRRFEGRTFDCGSKIGFLTANFALALDRPDLGPGKIPGERLDSALLLGQLDDGGSQLGHAATLADRQIPAPRQPGAG